MKWPNEYDFFFSCLRGVRNGGSGRWIAFCPGHDDVRGRSLSLMIGSKGRLLLKCHSNCGCTPQSIVASLGFTMRHLHLEGKNEERQPRQIVARYPYYDESGTQLYEVVRFVPKDFKQRRFNPKFTSAIPESRDNPLWVWNIDGVRRVPYRLLELMADLRNKPNEPVAIVEGEKDVDNLRSLGVTATCSPLGSGKFHFVAEDFRRLLRGRKVAVIVDNDDEGFRHAVDCCRVLFGVASKLKMVSFLGKGKDVSDWLAEDVTRDKLSFWSEVSKFQEWHPGCDDFFACGSAVEVSERVLRVEKRVASRYVPLTEEEDAVDRLLRLVRSLNDAKGKSEAFLDVLAAVSVQAKLFCRDLVSEKKKRKRENEKERSRQESETGAELVQRS